MLHSIYGRLTLLVMVLAIAGLALTTLRPVDAAPARAATPGQVVYGYADGPEQVTDTMTKVRSMKLPAGVWAISAKLFVEGGTYADCVLGWGADYDIAKAGLYGTSGATITETLSMQIAVSRTTAGKVKVSCTDQGGTMNWWSLKITAVSGDTLKANAL